MTDTQQSMVLVSSVPREIQTWPSLKDLWPQITGFVGVCAFWQHLLNMYLFVQNQAPVRVCLTNICIACFKAFSAMSVDESLILFIFMAFVCQTKKSWENNEYQRKRLQVQTKYLLQSCEFWFQIDQDNNEYGDIDQCPEEPDLQEVAADGANAHSSGSDSKVDAGPVAIVRGKPVTQKRKEYKLFENLIKDLCFLLGYILVALICLMLMPDVSPGSLLENLRTEDRQNQNSACMLLIILTFLLRMKVPQDVKSFHIVITTFVFNCVFHSEFNTLSNLYFQEKECLPRIFCEVLVMGCIIKRAGCLGNLSHFSSFGMQTLFLYALFEDPQLSWEKAALCGIYICYLLYGDNKTEWPCKDTVTTPLCIVPGCRLYNQGCWHGEGRTSYMDYETHDDAWLKNYDHCMKIMAIVIFLVNCLVVWIHCSNTRKRLIKALKRHWIDKKQSRKSWTDDTIQSFHVLKDANLMIYAIVIAWSLFELLPSDAQFTLFKMMFAENNFLVKLFTGEAFQEDTKMSITCSWSTTKSNSSWFPWK